MKGLKERECSSLIICLLPHERTIQTFLSTQIMVGQFFIIDYPFSEIMCDIKNKTGLSFGELYGYVYLYLTNYQHWCRGNGLVGKVITFKHGTLSLNLRT